MRKASKWIALLSAVALIGSVFAGCGEGESETQSTGATSSAATSQTESTTTEESSQVASQGTTSAEVESTASQAQGTASDSASTTSKPATTTSKPATTSSSTSSKAPDKVIQIPVDVKWALDPTLSYENIIPTADGKNWIAISEDGHKLINIAGKVLLSAYQIRTDSGVPDRLIVIDADYNYGMADTSGKMILSYQPAKIIFYGDKILQGGEEDYTIINKDGSNGGKYPDMVGFGGPGSVDTLFDKTTGKAWEILDYPIITDPDDFIGTWVSGDGYTLRGRTAAYIAEGVKIEEEEITAGTLKGMGVVEGTKVISGTLYASLSWLKKGTDVERDLWVAGNIRNGELVYGLTIAKGGKVHDLQFQAISANTNCTHAAVKKEGKWGFILLPTL